jgi:hypothetical protein
MRTVWIVRWRGFDEELLSPQEALDRWERLDAFGIAAEVFKVEAGRRVPVRW